MSDATVVCCPGKVLIAGGYLVLDSAHTGLVVATASRFYTVVKHAKRATADCLRITVRSPQFEEATWIYECRTNGTGQNCSVRQTDASSRNPFVQIALEETCRVLLALTGESPKADIDVLVLGDNDFYSQQRNSTAPPRPFRQLGTTLGKVHKTGLGSSAAMVTSLVGALLHHFGIDILKKKHLLHNLAQYAHSLAQGKIGSGFDVSAAVFGTQSYRRFEPSCLPSLSAAAELSAKGLLAALDPEQNAVWRQPEGGSVAPFALPPLTAMVLADVDAGSNTPSMVSKVLAWRKAEPQQADQLWTTISEQNKRLADGFRSLQTRYDQFPAEYAEAVRNMLGASETQQTDSLKLLRQVQSTISHIRQGMREMGEKAAVPIEPPSQTALLDTLSKCRGVLGGGVPGAGGYDAIWVLVLAPDDSTIDELEKTLATYAEASVRPLSKAARVYGPRESHFIDLRDGIQVEKLDAVAGLADAVAL